MIRLLLLALVAAAFATGCATGAGAAPSVASLVDPSASPDSPGASPSASLSPEDAMLAFTTCMREHGVAIEDPKTGTGGGGVSIALPASGTGGNKDFEKFQAADEACRHFLGDAQMGPGKGMDQETQDALLAFARCMRENGVDMPDPVFENGGGMVRIGGPDDNGGPKFDPGSADFKAAEETCRHFLPGGGEGIDGGPGFSVGGPASGGKDPGGVQIQPAVPGNGSEQ